MAVVQYKKKEKGGKPLKTASSVINGSVPLNKEVHLWERVVNTMPGSVFVKNKRGEYLWVNDNFIKHIDLVHGVVDSIIGKKDSDVFPEVVASAYSKGDDKPAEEGDDSAYETSFISRKKKQSWIQVVKNPLYDESGCILGLIAHVSDVTESHLLGEKVKRLKVINQSQSDFVANLSHDIHIPLMGVSNLLTGLSFSIGDMLSALGYNPNSSREKLTYFLDMLVNYTKEYIAVAKSSADELIRSLDCVLDDVHPSYRRYQKIPSSFNLPGLIQSVVDLLQSAAKHKHIKLEFTVDEWLPVNLSGLHFFLHRVLLNLTHYILSVAGQGVVSIAVNRADLARGEYSVGDEVELKIEINHSGGDIDNKKWGAVFEAGAATNNIELRVVKQYMADLDGAIDINNKVHEGSGFILTLPLTAVEWSPAVYSPLPASAQPQVSAQLSDGDSYFTSLHRKSGFSVLLVEDDLITATATSRALYHLGCKVSWAKNGAEAVRKASEEDYNLIFMDVGLPDASGVDVTKKIRNFNDPKKSQVFIVALTAFAEEARECKRCLDAGMQDVLSKPADLADLKATLDYFVWKTRKRL